MSLLKVIQDDQLSARKAKDAKAASLLTTLLSEAIRIGKDDGNRETTDVEVVAYVKKMTSGVEECVEALAPWDERIPDMMKEIELLKKYLPQQLSEAELRKVISDANLGKNVGAVMKFLKENYAGKYDAKLASEIVKAL